MIRELIQRIGGQWVFLALVAVLYAVLAVVNPESALRGLEGFVPLLLNILPALALVFGLLFLTNLFARPEVVLRYLGKTAGMRAWLVVIVAGILSAGPIYLWYPLLSDLKEKGMRDGLIAAFLYNRSVKIPLISVMIVYFGPRLVAVVLVLTVLFSVVDGLLVELITTKKEPTT